MRIAISTNWNSFRHETADALLEEIVSLGFDTVELGYALTHRQADGIAAWRDGGEPKDAVRVGAAPAKRASRDVFCYFDNTDKVHAPRNAARLAALLDDRGSRLRGNDGFSRPRKA